VSRPAQVKNFTEILYLPTHCVYIDPVGINNKEIKMMIERIYEGYRLPRENNVICYATGVVFALLCVAFVL
jgi:hypothetical protein